MALESYVILGNDALLKCEVPSFVSDLVDVDSWLDNQGQSFLAGSFGDFYFDDLSKRPSSSLSFSYKWLNFLKIRLALTISDLVNNRFFFRFQVVTQSYACYVNQAHVIRGNDVLMKCDIPSFVTDFVELLNWQDNEDNIFSARSLSYG